MKSVYYIWSLFERFGASAVSLVGNIVLAAMLTPDDFGLVAMLGVFTSLVFSLIDCGMSDGLLREAAPSRRDFNTLFFFNVGVGIAICLIFVAFSPWVARFFGRGELCHVMAVLGTGAVFSGLSVAQSARLRSQLKFSALSCINVASVSLALMVAIAMAWMGFRYWALVELQVGFSAFYFLLLVVFSRWQLRWEFDVARFRQLWRFGFNLLISSVVVQVSQNMLALILGRYYSAVQAGYMGQAQKLQQAPVNALEMGLSNATYVLVAKEPTPQLQDEAFVRVFRAFTLALVMSCALGIVFAHLLVEFIFPPRWLPVVPYLRLLLCWAMVYPLGNFMMVMLKLRDRTAVMRNIIIAERLAVIIAALVLWRAGVVCMIVAFTIISAMAVWAYMWQCSLVSSIRVARLLGIYAISLLLSALLALTLWWLLAS